MPNLPQTQYAVQLVGPDKLVLNKSKAVSKPGRHQILCRIEAVGLCFSDLKLLKQFSGHVRKSKVVSGIEPEVLEEIPSYVPGDAPTVPGHEAIVRIEAVGEEVNDFEPGRRYLVQTDYRWIRLKQNLRVLPGKVLVHFSPMVLLLNWKVMLMITWVKGCPVGKSFYIHQENQLLCRKRIL